MELYELRYFVTVAHHENLHRAATELRLSTAALSKTIARLEAELDVELFCRKGRAIELNECGRFLKERAVEMLKIADETRLSISGKKGSVHAILAGRESLMAYLTPEAISKISARLPNAVIETQITDLDEQTIQLVAKGEVSIGCITSAIPAALRGKSIGTSVFRTCVGEGHPLWDAASKRQRVSIHEVLNYPFVAPNRPLFGRMALKQSMDGWRDDHFRRQIFYTAPSLHLLCQIIERGQAIAYLPDYVVRSRRFSVLDIEDCPFSCAQDVRLIVLPSQLTGEMLKIWCDTWPFH